ncbi:MAG: trigger factor [Bacillota bacterium]|nr:trigger factor [Bacillota bacterium]
MIKKIGIFGFCIMIISSFMFVGCGTNMLYSDINLDDYIKVGEYKGIEVKKIDAEVTDSELQKAIDEDLAAAAKSSDVKKGEAVKSGDKVNIDYVGKIDGKDFDGNSAQGYDLTLGTGTFIEGFEEGLEGHTVGEENIKLNLAFPLDYSEASLQGKDVVFTVKINSAIRSTKPDYDDQFAKSQGDYKNVAEYEKAKKKALLKDEEEKAKSEQADEIWSKVIENVEVKKYPEDIVNNFVETFDSQIDAYAASNGTDRKTLIAQYYGADSEDVLKKQLEESAQLLVKQEMTIEYIAKAEDLSYTDEEMDKMKETYEAQGYTDESIKAETGRPMDEYIHINLLYMKVRDFLVENAKIK